MSDTFDHECDAFDRMANGEGEEVDDTWVCEGCGRSHPGYHRDCWWCNPGKKD